MCDDNGAPWNMLLLYTKLINKHNTLEENKAGRLSIVEKRKSSYYENECICNLVDPLEILVQGHMRFIFQIGIDLWMIIHRGRPGVHAVAPEHVRGGCKDCDEEILDRTVKRVQHKWEQIDRREALGSGAACTSS